MIYSKGFTLIELLLVIAIIGILGSVVLASLSTARAKGADALIIQTVTNMRAEAELFYDDNGSYLSMCDDTIILGALDRASSTNGGVTTCVDGSDVSERWAIEAQLVVTAGEFFCIDNDGMSEVYIGSTVSADSGLEDAVCGP